MSSTPLLQHLFQVLFVTSFLSASASAQLCGGTTYVAGPNAASVSTTDLNLDGKPDVLVGTNAGIVIAFGSGNGAISGSITHTTPSTALWIATGDLNNDGKPDVASSNGGFAQVLVMLGNGTGSLGAPVAHSVNGDVNDIVIHDFNCDGKADIATANKTAQNVSVIFGNGFGSFGAPVMLTGGLNPESIAAADVNLDGTVDLVTANHGSGGLWFHPNQGGGSFGSPVVALPILGFPDLAIGDVNNDGRPDAAATTTLLPVHLFVYVGTGSGFSLPTTPSGTNAFGVEICDLNQDGKQDLVSATQGTNTVSWAAGNGNATFAPLVSYASGGGPVRVASADFNLDGRLDVVATNQVQGTLSVLLGNVGSAGAPQFATPDIYNMGVFVPARFVVTDFNEDGSKDIIFGNSVGGIGYLANNGTGSLTYAGSAASTWANMKGMVMGDLNCDGNQDLCTAAFGTWGVVISFMNSAGGIIAGNSFSNIGGNNCSSIAVADLNLDGRLDLVTTEESTNQTFTLIGNGTVSPTFGPILSGGTTPRMVAVDDINSDGDPDIVVGHAGTPINATVYMGQAGTTFSAPSFFNVGGAPADLRIGDVNHDGRLDIAVAIGLGFSGGISVLNGDGTGSFGSPVINTNFGQNFTSMDMADLNLDGNLDAAIASNCIQSPLLLGNGMNGFISSGNLPNNCGTTDIALADLTNDGRPDVVMTVDLPAGPFIVLRSTTVPSTSDKFSNANDIPTTASPLFVTSGDMNYDGFDDLVTSDFSSGNISIRFNSFGRFGPEVSYPVGSAPRPLALGDLNMDGRLDVVCPIQGAASAAVRLGVGAGVLGPLFTYATGPHPLSAAIGDLDGDGAPDVVTPNYLGSTISLLFNTGAGAFGPPANLNVGPLPQFATLAHINTDGILDIVVATSGTNSFDLLLGNGGGNFLLPTAQPLLSGSTPTAISAGDLNQDGTTDLVVNNFNLSQSTLFFGDGAGSFNSQGYWVGTQPIFSAAGDLNFDGLTDVAIANYAGGSLSILHGIGGGNFVHTENHVVGSGPRNVTIADYNLDGRPDMATACFLGSNISILTNAGATPPAISSYGTGTWGCNGQLVLNANKTPKINTPDFALTCTNGPRNTLGLGLVTDVADFIGTDSVGLFVLMHVDLINFTEFYWFNFYMDAAGIGYGPIAIPNDNSLIGKTYYIQNLAYEDYLNGESCSTSLFNIVTSKGLQLVVQP